MTSDSHVYDFLREVLNLGQMKVPGKLDTVLKHLTPFKNLVPFTFLLHIVSANHDSLCMLTTPYPYVSPSPTVCHKSHTTKARKPHARVLITRKAQAQNQSTSDMPVHSQSTYRSQSKLF